MEKEKHLTMNVNAVLFAMVNYLYSDYKTFWQQEQKEHLEQGKEFTEKLMSFNEWLLKMNFAEETKSIISLDDIVKNNNQNLKL